MSRVPLGKVLLRNVIRHTDAHNKIQEESEMWKMRDWEKQMSQKKTLPDTEFFRGRMHCDRESDSREPAGSIEPSSGHDDREARYWSRKLYQFEANDPNRWGHSGFKELYPEDFTSNSEEDIKNNGRHKTKDAVASSKRSKKSSQKKKKKKKREDEKDRHKREPGSSSDGSSGNTDARRKQRHKRTKSKRKSNKSSKHRVRQDESSSEEMEEEGAFKRKGHSHKKRKRNKDSDSEMETQKKRRKSWKATNEEKSDDSSGD